MEQNKRSCIRQSITGVAVDLVNGQTRVNGSVVNLSNWGCCVAVGNRDGLQQGHNVEVCFKRTFGPRAKRLERTLRGKVVHVEEQVIDRQVRIQFQEEARLEAFGGFSSCVSRPIHDVQTRMSAVTHQNALALSDISSLQASLRDLKARQFQLFLSSIPMFITIIGAFIASLVDVLNSTPEWLFPLGFLPLAAGVLSYALFAVFLQKSSSINRMTAFSLLLQRAVALQWFPSGYRGWEDAYANYNRIKKYGIPPKSKLHVDSRKDQGIKEHFLPADSFKILCASIYMAIPFLSVSVSLFIFHRAQISPLAYTLTVATCVVAVLGASIAFGRQLYLLAWGRKSFDHMLILFSKLLKYCPQYHMDRIEEKEWAAMEPTTAAPSSAV